MFQGIVPPQPFAPSAAEVRSGGAQSKGPSDQGLAALAPHSYETATPTGSNLARSAVSWPVQPGGLHDVSERTGVGPVRLWNDNRRRTALEVE
jgi:hypothetical protein